MRKLTTYNIDWIQQLKKDGICDILKIVIVNSNIDLILAMQMKLKLILLFTHSKCS